MNIWNRFSILFLLLCLMGAVLTSGCVSTKEGRGMFVRAAADASGNPFAKIAAGAVYGSSDAQEYNLPEGWGLGFAPVDVDGNWIDGVAGYLPFIYSHDIEQAPSFVPAAFVPANMLMPAPSGSAPAPLRPAPVKETVPDELKPAALNIEALINEVTQ